ncbi:saccharopine dehydrogenase NADP-binding domain-containing protein [Burkholderia sp. Ac-20379]|uniref:saccharopine dehydrogenase NADP-binding domain-containing protein n=1 Tax=Burkholderia sp. Ac-20379 TaxID=2703900 RepID=UPI001980F09B|nr:saccharopine dehydrogenase NADP-binding domain-containing protein [Burkholderia sp. Ac-20379]MBN3728041.1 homospermidine synthase [Burkholderia sp. Ac-20379]
MNSKRQVVIVGFGNLGQAILPLLRTAFPEWAMTAVEQHDDDARATLAAAWDVRLVTCRVDAANYVQILGPLLGHGDFLLNLATTVETAALIALAQQSGAFYLDTCIEPWAYSFESGESTTNHALREQILALAAKRPATPTALVAHGANPGFVSVLTKCALVDMATRFGLPAWRQRVPRDRREWAQLAADLDVRVIQISERDTQRAAAPDAETAWVNTWSVDGFIAECRQDAEVGWGTHEAQLPPGARRFRKDGGVHAAPAIRLATNGVDTRVRTWTPLHGAFDAHVLTHNESLSIADYLTLGDGNGRVDYRPTVYYAYCPIEAALAWMPALAGGSPPAGHETGHPPMRVLKDELATGVDELGVLVMSGRGESLWLGSALSIERTRTIAPLNNATSLQVVSSIVGGMQWMLDHPRAGIVESDALDHAATFARVRPFWEPMQRVWTRWRPGGAALQFDDFLAARGDADDATHAAAFNLDPISS